MDLVQSYTDEAITAALRDPDWITNAVIEHHEIWVAGPAREHMREILAAAPEPEPTGTVYIIRDEAGRFKIGFTSKTAMHRLGQLEKATGLALTLVAAFAGTRTDESVLHKRFSVSRTRGEWFAASDDLTAWVAGLQ